MRRGGAVLTGAVAVVLVACSASDGGVTTGTTATAPVESAVASTVGRATEASRPTGGGGLDPDEPYVSSSSNGQMPVFPEGFERVRATVSLSDGSVCELCVWLAETEDQRRQGLMRVTDLGPADGMAFVYPVPHTGNFWMKDTVLPLSIAFFGQDGGFLGSFDMDPCVADPCPLYRTEPDFVIAVETAQGGLADLGVVVGSGLELTDLPCAP